MSKKSFNKKNRMNDFLRYRQNKMSGVEKNAFERELQRDSFAAEAMEGVEEISPEEFRDDLKYLLKNHNSRYKSKKAVLFYRIAASLVILLSISSLLYILTRTNENQISERIAEAVTPFEIIEAKPITENLISEDISEINEQMPVNKASVSGKKEGIKSTVEPDKQSEALMDTIRDKYFEKKIQELSRSDTYRNETVAAAPLASKSMGKQTGSENIKRMAKMADNIDSLKFTSIEISDEIAEEVVVIGYGQKKAEPVVEIENPGNSSAKPAYGNAHFKKYIADNLIRPDTLSDQRIVVIACFVVTDDGYIDSIRILKSPGHGFTNEATRLIKNSPPWNPAEENGIKVNSEVRLRIIFR